MKQKIRNAYEITDAKISFVSLVDKAANKRQFLITKAENGQANFASYGRIVKADAETHHVTGVVYEPMVEDSHGNYMTEAEITKAAYWFAKNGDKVDLQHSFEPMEGATVVETWIAKADFQIGDETITKGTWLMTVEVKDDAVWEGIQKKEITGFSMGGIGNYSEEDTDLETVEKSTAPQVEGKRGLLAKLAEALGFKMVEKGEMAEIFEEKSRGTLFWNAMNTLEECLYRYNPVTGRYAYESDEQRVRDCLSDFCAIVTDLLTNEHSITAALTAAPVQKAGKKMSTKNRQTLAGIYESLGSFLKEFDETEEVTKAEDPAGNTITKEENEVTKTEVETIVAAAIAKALNPAGTAAPAEVAPVEKAAEAPATTPAAAPDAVTPEAIEKMVGDAIAKAMPQAEPSVSTAEVEQIVSQAVAKAMEPILKSRGLPTNMNGNPAPVEKTAEPHYLHGIL